MRTAIVPGFLKYPSSLQWDNRHSVVVVFVTCGCCCKKILIHACPKNVAGVRK